MGYTENKIVFRFCVMEIASIESMVSAFGVLNRNRGRRKDRERSMHWMLFVE